ncbi:MAG: hypothetical protein OEY70_15775 [Acidimicrobiia bacterium]|nr:hypothetical protein [Acidimicrobiia bacterium]
MGGVAGLFGLVIGALVLSALAVLIDRLNFPQRPFKPRTVPVTDGKEPPRDRTGAHMVDESGEPAAPADR